MDGTINLEHKILFSDWIVVETIGQGSYGTVYKVTREVLNGYIQTCAVKVITFPTKTQIENAETALGTDQRTLTKYFENKIRQIVQEIEVLDNLSNHPNIIGYKDHKIIRHTEGIGWDILIRMEYVTPLRQYMREHAFSYETGLRLGVDILSALEVCEARNVMHRDIKDDNIFVDPHGVFKLGDFGIAKQLAENTSTATRGMGTPWYMAPEVYSGKHYDHHADLYSLGLVLYRFFNNQCMPFVPPEDPNTAFELRMSGKPLPEPRNTKGDVAKIILKACTFNVDERYTSAAEMKQAFTALLFQEKEAVKVQRPSIEINSEKQQEHDQTELPSANGKTQSLFERNIILSPDLATQPKEKPENVIDVQMACIKDQIVYETPSENSGVAMQHSATESYGQEILDSPVHTVQTHSQLADQVKQSKKRSGLLILHGLTNVIFGVWGSILLDVVLILVLINQLDDLYYSGQLVRYDIAIVMQSIMLGLVTLDLILASIAFFPKRVIPILRKKIGLIRAKGRFIFDIVILLFIINGYYAGYYGDIFLYDFSYAIQILMISIVAIRFMFDFARPFTRWYKKISDFKF